MVLKNKNKMSCGVVFLASAVVLSGCTGTSTYGTGKTQERQLFDDITGIVSLGGEKKEPIDYSSRSGLVKPPAQSALPAPAESIKDGAGYFPEDAGSKRQRLLAAIEEAEANGTELPPEVVEARRQSAAAQTIQRPRSFTRDGDEEEVYNPQQARIAREAFLKQKAELAGVRGAAPRKYLTEPKSIYRTPADTAPAGVVGEEAANPLVKKKKKSLWGILTGD